jgi:hypothetical protein
VFWLYTIGAGRLQPAMQPDEVSLANLERMTSMIDDLDSFEALQRSPAAPVRLPASETASTLNVTHPNEG